MEKSALDKSKMQFNQVGSLVATDFSSFYCLLVVVPEMTECYETLNVLRYFDFPIKVDEDNILRQGVKKEMGFRPEDQVSILNPYRLLVPSITDRLFLRRDA